jgi:hypothetical protein
MKINPVGHPANVIQPSKHEPIQSSSSQSESANSKDIAAAAPVDRVDLAAPVDNQLTVVNGSSTESSNTPGVIRLLEAGHFKGVADVRLRINFFDELSERRGERTTPVIREHADEFVRTITGQVDHLIGPLTPNEEDQAAVAELVGQFNAQVQDAVTSASPDNIDTLVTSLGSAFDALDSQLRELLTATDASGSDDATPDATSDATKLTIADGQPAPTQLTPILDERTELDSGALTGSQDPATADGSKLIRTGDAVIVEPLSPREDQTKDTSVSLDDALAALRQAFEGALTSLTTAISEVSLIPNPTAPNGNGGAYAKFLGAYNELRGSASSMIELSA